MPMVSPLMELSVKNLSGKAFRFGIFWRPNPIPRGLLLPLFRNGNSPVGSAATGWAGKAAGRNGCCLVDQSLGKVARIGVSLKKESVS